MYMTEKSFNFIVLVFVFDVHFIRLAIALYCRVKAISLYFICIRVRICVFTHFPSFKKPHTRKKHGSNAF